MEAMRQSWTDDRLDDLSREMNRRFDVVDRRFDKVDERFDKVDRRFEKVEGEMKAGFQRLGGEFAAFYRLLVIAMVTMLAAVLGVLAALVAG